MQALVRHLQSLFVHVCLLFGFLLFCMVAPCAFVVCCFSLFVLSAASASLLDLSIPHWGGQSAGLSFPVEGFLCPGYGCKRLRGRGGLTEISLNDPRNSFEHHPKTNLVQHWLSAEAEYRNPCWGANVRSGWGNMGGGGWSEKGRIPSKMGHSPIHQSEISRGLSTWVLGKLSLRTIRSSGETIAALRQHFGTKQHLHPFSGSSLHPRLPSGLSISFLEHHPSKWPWVKIPHPQ